MMLSRAIEDVVCPFCSLACDDLAVAAEGEALQVRAGTCPIAEREFARPAVATGPTVDGAPATLEAAVDRAAALLGNARLPLYGGLGTDLAGTREVLALAERTGGVVDHTGSAGLLANLRAMQDGGWVTTTLAEVRNRADLLLFVATDATAVAPRFVERCVAVRKTLFGPLTRDLVYLGDGLRPAAGASGTMLPCAPERLAGAVALLRALVAGAAPDDAPPDLIALAGKLRAASYPVIVWAAAELPGRHADLLVGALAGLTRDLNATRRCAGLPLAGPNNIIGVNQACAWQTGVPLRTNFATAVPDHDPARWSSAALLAAGTVDALLWIATLRALPVPEGAPPTVALVRPGDPPPPAEVVIPVGVPGLDHAGSLYRTDGVVAVPVRPLRELGLPSAAAVLRRIGKALGAASTAAAA